MDVMPQVICQLFKIFSCAKYSLAETGCLLQLCTLGHHATVFLEYFHCLFMMCSILSFFIDGFPRILCWRSIKRLIWVLFKPPVSLVLGSFEHLTYYSPSIISISSFPWQEGIKFPLIYGEPYQLLSQEIKSPTDAVSSWTFKRFTSVSYVASNQMIIIGPSFRHKPTDHQVWWCRCKALHLTRKKFARCKCKHLEKIRCPRKLAPWTRFSKWGLDCSWRNCYAS